MSGLVLAEVFFTMGERTCVLFYQYGVYTTHHSCDPGGNWPL